MADLGIRSNGPAATAADGSHTPLAPNSIGTRTNRIGGKAKACFGLCWMLGNLLLLLMLLIISPLILVIFLVLCFLPVLDKLVHPCREYLDGTAAAQINHVEEGVIHGVIIMKEQVDHTTIFKNWSKTYLEADNPVFHRWKQRVVRPCWLWPYWTNHNSFDSKQHLFPHHEIITKEQLEQTIADFESKPMDYSKPVWEIHYYEKFVDEESRLCSAFLIRLHHCMADGYAGVRMLFQAMEPKKEQVSSQANKVEFTEKWAEELQRVGLKLSPDGSKKILCYDTDGNKLRVHQFKASGAPRFQLYDIPGQSKFPLHLKAGRPTCCQFVRFLLSSVKKLLLMKDDAPSIFKARARISPTSPRFVTWSTMHTSVEKLKAAGKRLGGASINDLLLVALSGALRSYGQESSPDNITSILWVSLAPLKNLYAGFDKVPYKWGNTTLGACYLPIGVGRTHESRLDVLADMRCQTGDPKMEVEALVGGRLQSIIGWLPRVAMKPIWPIFANKVTLSMSNMPGPQWDLQFCGGPASNMLFFVPPTGTISMFVTIATFNGKITIGMGSDGSLLSKEQLSRISGELFEAEINGLLNDADSMSPV